MLDSHAKFNRKVLFFVQILGHCIITHGVVNCFYKNGCLYIFYHIRGLDLNGSIVSKDSLFNTESFIGYR